MQASLRALGFNATSLGQMHSPYPTSIVGSLPQQLEPLCFPDPTRPLIFDCRRRPVRTCARPYLPVPRSVDKIHASHNGWCVRSETQAKLYVGGKPATLARSPNIAPDGTWLWYGYETLKIAPGAKSFTLNDTAAVAAMRLALASPSGVWMHGYWKFDWRDTYVRTSSVTEAGVVTWDPTTPPQYTPINGCRFYAVNSLEFVDVPGE
jgi:hypothetical protein